MGGRQPGAQRMVLAAECMKAGEGTATAVLAMVLLPL